LGGWWGWPAEQEQEGAPDPDINGEGFPAVEAKEEDAFRDLWADAGEGEEVVAEGWGWERGSSFPEGEVAGDVAGEVVEVAVAVADATDMAEGGWGSSGEGGWGGEGSGSGGDGLTKRATDNANNLTNARQVVVSGNYKRHHDFKPGLAQEAQTGKLGQKGKEVGKGRSRGWWLESIPR
jgi:hypothetical protein